MPVQVPRRGNPGRDKQCWVGIPGSQNVIGTSSPVGTVISVLSEGSSGGAWTYSLTETSPYFEVVGAELRTKAAVPAGSYYVQVKMTYGDMTGFRAYRFAVLGTGESPPPVGPDYAASMATIPNKVHWYRGDSSSAANGAQLEQNKWLNEGSLASAAGGGALWEVNSLNGMPGALATTSGQTVQLPNQLGDILLGGRAFTVFAVERRAGTQGQAAGVGRYTNNLVVGSTDYWSITFEGDSRRFYLYSYPGTFNYVDSEVSFTDNQAYVLAWRVNAAGQSRINFNGQVSAPAGSVGVPSSQGRTCYVNYNLSTTSVNRGYEYIITSGAASDTVMDNAVLALKHKWGIT